MELRLLRTFKAVADTGSFTRASRQVHLTQAAVSLQIKALEEELGTPLFLRVKRKVFLTEAGKLLRLKAELILREHDDAKAELATLSAVERGLLRIGIASAGLSAHPLPDILIDLKRRHPLAELQVHGGTSEWIVAQILADEIDVGLVSLPVEEPAIETKRLQSDRLVAIASPNWPLAGLSQHLTPRVLAAEPLILGERGGNTRRLIDLFFQRLGIEPQVIMELNRTESIKRMVELGFGLSILPSSSVRREVATGQLRAYSVPSLKLRWELGVAFLKTNHPSRLLRTFIELCETHISDREGS